MADDKGILEPFPLVRYTVHDTAYVCPGIGPSTCAEYRCNITRTRTAASLCRERHRITSHRAAAAIFIGQSPQSFVASMVFAPRRKCDPGMTVASGLVALCFDMTGEEAVNVLGMNCATA